ncbi:EAL domain-containing protein [Sphingomonas sp. RT2P30]|uniref:putative bifunctional diguanylate cyclase/phosphodiesterase n=1 Tax=Parasphingomonas halimpatiens TaxID=3096162 RepID=UPI002FCC3E68
MEQESPADKVRLDETLLAEQMRSLSSQAPTMFLFIIANTLVMQIVTASERWQMRSYVVSLIVTAVCTARIIRWRHINEGPPRSVAQMASLATTTSRSALVMASTLAGWSIYLLFTASAPSQYYVPQFTALSMIICGACLMGHPEAGYILIGLGAAPIAFALLFTNNAILMGTGISLLMVAALTFNFIRRQYLQLRRMAAAHADTRREQHKVAELAFSDQLTGLPNRRAFLDQLSAVDASDGKGAIAVAMLDLDGFKAINDTFGHLAGDGLLVAVARRLEALLDPGDLIVRLGGDEFALLLRDVVTLDAAHARLLPIAAAFERSFIVDGKDLMVSTSIGIAHGGFCDCSVVELIHRADLALYESKESGVQRICGFETAMEGRVRRRVLIEQAATDPNALATLTLQYQPVFDTATMTVDGFEALARWRHPVLGDISPAEFIAVAERRGITHRLTAILLRQALAAASHWPDGIGLSFNLSAVELNSPAVCALIFDLCAEHGFSPARLSIEITETALLRDFSAARAMIERLRHGGVRVLLDDFGAGYASIGYLRQIRFDGIKLDGSLIAPIAQSAAARNLLIGVMQLCRAISCPVTAEMVETTEHLVLLDSLGVDKVQGFLIGKPIHGDEVAAFLAAAHGAQRGRLRSAV